MPRISARGALPNTPCRQKTIGIDVDSQYLVVALFDASQPTLPVHEYPNHPAGIADLTARALQFAPEICAMESTGPYHAALYDALTQAGLFAVVLNPAYLAALLRAGRTKSDQHDAAIIARVAALFRDLKWSNMPDPWQRHCRAHLAAYDHTRTTIRKQHARLAANMRTIGIDLNLIGGASSPLRLALLRAWGTPAAGRHCHRIRTDQKRQAVRQMLAIPLTPPVAAYRQHALATIDALQPILQAQADWIDAETHQPSVAPTVDLITTVPCTSRLLALRCLAQFGLNLTQRYPTSAKFCAAAGTAPRQEITGGRVTKRTPQRPANPFAHHLAQHLWVHYNRLPPAWDRWLHQYQTRANPSFRKRLLALSHLVAESWYNVLKLQQPYDIYAAMKNKVEFYLDETTGDIT